MHIAIIGTGNVGGALATQWSKKGHQIQLGVKDINQFKGKELLKNDNTRVMSITEAVALSEVILLAIPPAVIDEVLPSMGNLTGKVVIDATNSINNQVHGHPTLFHYLAAQTNAELVKCFNSTGVENMLNPIYPTGPLDMFMAGDNQRAKTISHQLALDCGFGSCIDFGKSDKVELLEKFALSWINLAIMQGMGRGIGWKLERR